MISVHSRIMYRLFVITSILSLQGCSSVGHSAFFKEYERGYREKIAFKTHYVQQNGWKIHVREYGEEHKNVAPSLVMMHGFPDSMHLYDRLVPLLANDRHIITFDFIGWGDSDKPEQYHYDVASQRQNLEAVISYFKLKRIVPVLHDASGQPGIDWALDNPEKTAGLVLLNTYYSPMPTLKAPEAIARFSTPGFYRDVSVWATRNFDYLWIRGYNKQMAKFIRTKALREPFQKLLGYQSLQIRPAFYALNRTLSEELEKRRANIKRLKAFQPTVTIIFGNDDPYLNSGVAKEFHRLFPHSELHLIENAGHFVQIDAPERVAFFISSAG